LRKAAQNRAALTAGAQAYPKFGYAAREFPESTGTFLQAVM
jgi:hypothetical protein